MLNIATLLGSSAAIWAVAIAAALLLSALGVQTVRLANSKAETAEVSRAWAADRASTAAAAIQAAADNATETTRRLTAQKAADDQQTQALALARSDAVAAADSLRRLRERAAATLAGSGGSASDPAATAVSPAASAAGVLCADVLSRVGEAARQLAEHADTGRAAGLACEQRYDALTPPGYTLPAGKFGGH